MCIIWMIVNLSLSFVLPCSCVTGMVFTSCESPLQGKSALQSGHFAWPGLEYTFLNGFFPQSGVFRSFSYPRDAPFQLLLVHDLNVNKAVTVSTKALLHQ